MNKSLSIIANKAMSTFSDMNKIEKTFSGLLLAFVATMPIHKPDIESLAEFEVTFGLHNIADFIKTSKPSIVLPTKNHVTVNGETFDFRGVNQGKHQTQARFEAINQGCQIANKIVTKFPKEPMLMRSDIYHEGYARATYIMKHHCG